MKDLDLTVEQFHDPIGQSSYGVPGVALPISSLLVAGALFRGL